MPMLSSSIKAMFVLAAVIASTALWGCASTRDGRLVNLKSLTSMTYTQQRESLTARTTADLGMWRDITISATLLHRTLADYRQDVPEDALGIDFAVEGAERGFAVENIIFIIEDDKGGRAVISGLGTDKVMVKGELGGRKPEVRYEPQEGGGPEGEDLYRFRLLVSPNGLDMGVSTLQIRGEDLHNPDIIFLLKWRFV